MSKKIIYCGVERAFFETTDVLVAAICEDGKYFGNQFAKNIEDAKFVIGECSGNMHDKYQEHCPEGYQIVWQDNLAPRLKELTK